MEYSEPMKGFQRYMRAFQKTGGPPVDGPEDCYGLCHSLLGCTELMPGWLRKELQEHEGVDEESVTFHEAAVDLLTERIIDGEPPKAWEKHLSPIFLKVCEVNHTEATRAGFAAWLGTMVDEDGLIEALGE